MKVKFLPVVILILIQSLSFAQNGILKGKIIDAVTREPVPFAGVALQGTTTGTATAIDGNFVISAIEPGVYNILINVVGYEIGRAHV